jgi:hypothetical protein
MKFIQQYVALVALATANLNATSAEPAEMFWFINEVHCAGEKIVIRSYCEVTLRENASVQVNHICSAQEILFQGSDGKQRTVDLLKKEPWKGDMHVVNFLQCAPHTQHRYFLLSYGNGGNCDTCELQALLGRDGKWKRYGNKSFPMSRAEKADINAHLTQWQKAPSNHVTNASKDTQQDQ